MRSKLFIGLSLLLISCHKDGASLKQTVTFDKTIIFRIAASEAYASAAYQNAVISVRLNIARESLDGGQSMLLDTLIGPKKFADGMFQGAGFSVTNKVSALRLGEEKLRCSYVLTTVVNGYRSQFANGNVMPDSPTPEEVLIKF